MHAASEKSGVQYVGMPSFPDCPRPKRDMVYSGAERENALAAEAWKQAVSLRMAGSLYSAEVNMTTGRILRLLGLDNRTADLYIGTSYDALTEQCPALIHPEDAERFRAFLDRRRLLRLAAQGGFTDELEFRMLRQKQPVWRRAEVWLVRSPLTEEVRMYVSVTDTDALHRTIRRLAEQAARDPLTGLYNRSVAADRIRGALEAPRGVCPALLILDLDNFKQLNDLQGHPAGDAALRAVADTLRQVLGAHGLAARLGGDEFMAFLQEAGDPQTALRTAESVSLSLQAKGLAASIGVACSDKEQEAYEGLYARADRALYRAKQAGKNQCCLE